MYYERCKYCNDYEASSITILGNHYKYCSARPRTRDRWSDLEDLAKAACGPDERAWEALMKALQPATVLALIEAARE